MASGSPKKAYLIGKESTKYTPVTLDKDIGIIQDVAENPERTIIPVDSMGAIETQSYVCGQELGSHTVNMWYHNGRIFEFIVGEAGHAETTGDWVHTFTLDDDPKSFTAGSGENATSETLRTYPGCMIETAEINTALNEIAGITFTAQGQIPTSSTTAPAQIIGAIPVFCTKEITVKVNTVLASSVQSAVITFTKVNETVYGLGAVALEDMQSVSFKIAFEFTIWFSDEVFQEHFIDNDITSVELILDNGVALGSGKRGLDILLDVQETANMAVQSSIGGMTAITISSEATLNTLTTTDNISSANWF